MTSCLVPLETMAIEPLAEALEHVRRDACRAVGLANGRNPISIILPCHRVIGADGSLTGYGWGVDRKEWLLRHEGVVGAWAAAGAKTDAEAAQATLW